MFAISVLFLMSCDDDEKAVTPIHRIEATSTINLSKYTNKTCIVNDESYDFEIVSNRLTAIPQLGEKVAYTKAPDSLFGDPDNLYTF